VLVCGRLFIEVQHEVDNDNKLLVSYELRRKVEVQLEVQDVLHLKTIRYSDVCTNYSICVCNVLS